MNEAKVKFRILLIILIFVFGGLFSLEAKAVSWQCPGHKPSVELKKLDELQFMEIDRYRGYKPAWMAVDKVYRSAIYSWKEEEARSSYLEDRNSYLDFYMYNERLRLLMERYPGEIEVWEIARTHFGYPVYAVLIGNSEEKHKADILQMAGIHGNEMITLNYTFDSMEMLLHNQNDIFTSLKSRFNFWFIPMANPDGNWLSMRRAHASTYGKKNGRNTDGTCETFAYEGIDLSQNFPQKHAEKEIEAEVAGLVQLVESQNFVLGLSLHTGGKGFYSPPQSPGQGSNDHLTLNQFTTDVAGVLTDFERRPLMKKTDLGEIVWLYKEKKIPSFIFDYPEDIAPMEHSEREAARVMFQTFIIEFWASLDAQAFLQGAIVDQEGKPIIDAKLHQVQSLRKEIVWDIPENGQFSMIFPHKKVITLRVTAEGYVDAEKRIDLREGSAKTRIVLLKRTMP